MIVRNLLKSFCPPVVWTSLSRLHKAIFKRSTNTSKDIKTVNVVIDNPKEQDLDLYWTPEMANILDEWGDDNVWNEIQLLLCTCKGKILDIACGTGKTIKLIEKFPNLDIYGCDISDLFIEKSIEKGISKDKLVVCDATNTGYMDDEFEYSYSIGSLEHFTLEGIDAFIKDSARITSQVSFHMIPTSLSKTDEGWLKTVQSYFNNSDDWWLQKFEKHYHKVVMVNSKWNDNISFGRWFICYK